MKILLLSLMMLTSLLTYASEGLSEDHFRTEAASHDYPDHVKKTIILKNKGAPNIKLLLEKNGEDGVAYYVWLAVKKSDNTWNMFDIADATTCRVIPTNKKNIVKFETRAVYEDGSEKTLIFTIDITNVLVNDTIRILRQ